ncbi:MAG: YwhD family protein [Candidatus Omnitrophica bacterium]|nr:YwhD family protein [Candidatus Omnitrophota bacterium]
MTTAISLSTGMGEIMAPQTLLTALILAPDGAVRIEPGALHGRSSIEASVRFVQSRDQLQDPQLYWVVWVAIELEASTNRPVRYTGLAAAELWVDSAKQACCKVLAEHVNRMAEALRGGISLKSISGHGKALIAQQLIALGAEVWDHSSQTLKEALA